MKSTRLYAPIFGLVLTGLLFTSGCKKQTPQPENNPTTATAPQPAAPQPATPPAQQPAQPAPSASAPAPAPSAAPGPAAAPGAAPPPEAAAAPPPPPPPPPPPLVVPAGSHIAVTVAQDLGSKISQSGQTFSATVATPIHVRGVTVIPAGARVAGTVVAAKAQGKIKGSGELDLRLDTVYVHGNSIPLQTDVLEREVKGKGKRTATMAGGGAGVGALIGGLAGGGKGAAIGALVGGAGGTAGAAYTKNEQIVIPAESTVTFRLSQSLTFPGRAGEEQGPSQQEPAEAPPPPQQ